MADTRVYTLEEVNVLLPKLNLVVGEQMRRRSEIETRLSELSAATGRGATEIAPALSDTPAISALKRDLAVRVEEYENGWRELEPIGGTLKDARLGLVDFYGRVDGKLVWLCWKYGETAIDHYHALDEGFAARKRIPNVVKALFLN